MQENLTHFNNFFRAEDETDKIKRPKKIKIDTLRFLLIYDLKTISFK